MTIDGHCDSAFSAVADALRDNVRHRGETGSAVAVYADGELVVDLWTGYLDAEGRRPWTASSITILYSIAKSICALTAHILVDEGHLDLDSPVADYWAEFGRNGKETILVRHLLAHWDGMSFPDHTSPGDIFDYEKMIDALERQEPAWPPGTRGAYNSTTYGFLVGELVRQVSGIRIERFVRERICEPLGVDYWFGVPADRLEDVADIRANPANHMYDEGNTPGTTLHRAWQPMPVGYGVDIINTRMFHTATVPSFGGHGAARGVARIYGALSRGGEIDDIRLLSSDAVQRLAEPQWESEADGTLGRPMRMALGFWLNESRRTPMGPNPTSFGHPGSGGSLAFADPENHISFASQTAQMSEGGGVGDRTRALVDAVYL